MCVICLVLAAGTAAVLLIHANRKKDAGEVYAELARSVNELQGIETLIREQQESEGDNGVLARLGIEVPVKNLDWDALHEENPDIYAWIYVPDTTVDYPVLQHPDDNSYYLNHNMDGSEGYPGCIYTEDYNSRDFSDPHTVIYGHNLRDKTMFSSLHNFENPAMVEEDHYIFIYTEEKTYVYEVFGAYEYAAIHLLDNYDLENEYVYEQYIRDVLRVDDTGARVANIRHDIEVTEENRIVTLSTCTSDHNSSLRFLVVGVLLNP